MNRFVPFRTYSPFSDRAVERIAAESEPEPDSVSAYAQSHSPDASRGRYRCFCSSSPASLRPSDPSSCTARISPLVAQTFETSSIAIRERSVPVPVPPYSSAKKSPKTSWSRKSSTTSHGNSCERSISVARGAIRSRASCRTRSRISRCSSLSGSYGTLRSLAAVVVHDLDVVAVGIEHEGAVVAWVVVRALAGSTVVAVPGLDGCAVKCVNGCIVAGGKRHVDVLRRRPADDGEGPALTSELGALGRVAP